MREPRAFTLGVLACDHVDDPVLVEAADGVDYDEMCAGLVTRHQDDLPLPVEVRIYDAVNGSLPSDPHECDGWIITGSRHDAYRDDPWLVALRDFIVRLYEAGARTVGICFGHQAVAHALGGRAEPAGFWKVGPQEMTVRDTPWFEGGNVTLYGMHRDVASLLPTDGVDIGKGTTAQHPLFMVGDSMLCMQDHPEFTHRYEAALIEARRARTGDAVADDGMASMSTKVHGHLVSQWITRFLFDIRMDSLPETRLTTLGN